MSSTSSTKKSILVVIEQPEGYPHPATQMWKEKFEEMGYEVTTIGKIVDAFSHLGSGDSKYDLVVLDPLNNTIIRHDQMRDADKAASLGVLARAQRNGAKTICIIGRGTTEQHFDMNALRTHTTQEVKHGDCSEMIETVKAMLPDGLEII